MWNVKKYAAIAAVSTGVWRGQSGIGVRIRLGG